MDPVVIISPHLDDAILSCGQFMADWPGCVVYTVCGGTPPEGTPPSTYDEHCGFSSPAAGLAVRRDEDRRAVGLLRGVSMYGHVIDNQYRTEPFPQKNVIAELVRVIEQIRPVRVFGPLGLLHPDHVEVSDATIEAMAVVGNGVELVLYEELPSRIIDPLDVFRRLDVVDACGYDVELLPASSERLGEKLVAVGEYASQSWAWKIREVACDERFWRVKRKVFS